jgi:biopolymer transport protein ExbD
MVAAPLPTVDVKVDLPPPGNPIYVEPKDKPTTVQLVDAGGTMLIYIETEYVTPEQFSDKLFKVVRERNPSYYYDLGNLYAEAKVFVDADQNTKYTNVISLINQIDEAGFKKVSLLVKSAAGT